MIKKYSYSSLQAYDELMIPYISNETDSGGSTLALELGDILHRGLELKATALIDNEEPNYVKIKEIVMGGTEKNGKYLNGINQLKLKYASTWKIKDSDSNLTYDEKINLYFQFLEADNMQEGDWKVVGAEIPFEFNFEDRAIITGIIDRVDQNTKTKEYRVIDYKSSKKMYDDEFMKLPLQQAIYSMACHSKYKKYPIENKYCFVLIGREQNATSDSLVEDAKVKIRSILALIKDQEASENKYFNLPSNIPSTLSKSKGFAKFYSENNITPVFHDDTYYLLDKNGYYVGNGKETFGDVATKYGSTVEEICNQNNLRGDKISWSTPIAEATMLIIPFGTEVLIDNIDLMQATGQYRIGEKMPNSILVPADCQVECYDSPIIDDRDKLDGIVRYMSDNNSSNIYNKDGELLNNVYSPYGKHYLRIGDCTLPISPLSITMSTNTSNSRIPAMRSRSSMQTQSGYSSKTIIVDLFFNNLETINGSPVENPIPGEDDYYRNGLRPLIAQFVKAPFLPIENELINDSFGIYNVALQDIQLNNVPGFPECMQATIVLKQFNHTTYMPDSDWFEGHFSWPIYRWYYQRAMQPSEAKKGHTVLSKIEKLNSEMEFYIPDRSILDKRQQAIKQLSGKKAPGVVQTQAENKTSQFPGEEDISLGRIQFSNFQLTSAKYPKGIYPMLYDDAGFNAAGIRETMLGILNGDNHEVDLPKIKYATAILEIYYQTYDRYERASYAIRGLDKVIVDSAFYIITQYATLVSDPSEKAKLIARDQSYAYIRNDYGETINMLNLHYNGSVYSQTGEFVSPEKAKEYLNTELKNQNASGVSLAIGAAAALAAIALLALAIPVGIAAIGAAATFAAYGASIVGAGLWAGFGTYNAQKDGIQKQMFSKGPSKTLYDGVLNGIASAMISKASSGVIVILGGVTGETDAKLKLDNLTSTNTGSGHARIPNYVIPANSPLLLQFKSYDQINQSEADAYKENIVRLQYLTHMSEQEVPNVKFDIDGDYWIQSISTSLNNKFAPLQVQMEEGPTFQYLGGGDIVTSVKIITKSRTAVASFKNLYRTINEIARTYRVAITSGVLTIDHSFLKLFGVSSVLIESMDIQTSQNDKESFNITMNIVSFDKTQRRREELDQFGFGDNFENFDQFKRFEAQNKNARGEEYGNVDFKLRNAELYPDLQLPTYAELDEALKYLKIKDAYGGPFLKYPNFNGGKFLDPDFYIRQEVTYRDIVETFLSDDTANELAISDRYGNAFIDNSPSLASQRATQSSKHSQESELLLNKAAKDSLNSSLPTMHTASLIANSQRHPASHFVVKAKELEANNPAFKDIPEANILLSAGDDSKKSNIMNLGAKLSQKSVLDIAGMRTIDVEISATIGKITACIYAPFDRPTTAEKENEFAAIYFKRYCEYLAVTDPKYALDELKKAQIVIYFRESKSTLEGSQKAVDIKTANYSQLYPMFDEDFNISILNLDNKVKDDMLNQQSLNGHLIAIMDKIGKEVLSKAITGSKTSLDTKQKELLLNYVTADNVYSNKDSLPTSVAQIGTIDPPTLYQIDQIFQQVGANNKVVGPSWLKDFNEWRALVISSNGATPITYDAGADGTITNEAFYNVPRSIITSLNSPNSYDPYTSKWYFRVPLENKSSSIAEKDQMILSKEWKNVILKCKRLHIKTDKLKTNSPTQIFKIDLADTYIGMKYNEKLGRWTPMNQNLAILDKTPQAQGVYATGGIDTWVDGYSVVDLKDYNAILDYYSKSGETNIFNTYADFSMVTVDRTTNSIWTGAKTSSATVSSSNGNQEGLLSPETRDNIIRLTIGAKIFENGSIKYQNVRVTVLDNNGELAKAYQEKYGAPVPQEETNYGAFLFGDSSKGGKPTNLSLTIYNAIMAHVSYEMSHNKSQDPNNSSGYFIVLKDGAAGLKAAYKTDGIHVTPNYTHIQESFLNQLSGDKANDQNIIAQLKAEYTPWLYTFHSATDINSEESQLTYEELANVFGTYKTAAQAIGEAEQSEFEEIYGGRPFENLEDIDLKRLYRSSFDSIFKYDQKSRLVRAFPSYQIFLIDEGTKTMAYRMWDNFFGYNSIVSLDVMKDRRIVADTVMMEMTNIYHNLSEYDNELTYGKGDFGVFDAFNFMDTSKLFAFWNAALGWADADMVKARQEQVQSLFLKAGARLHVRMGYGSNALQLPVVFNGTITEINTDEIITVVAQGDGIELTNKLNKGPNDTTDPGCLVAPYEPREFIGDMLTTKGGFFKSMINNISGGALFTDNPLGIQHFGNPYKIEPAALQNVMPLVKEWNSLTDVTQNYGDCAINVYSGSPARSFSQWIYDGDDAAALDHSFKISKDPNAGKWWLDPDGDGKLNIRWGNGDLFCRPQYNDAPNVRIYLQDMTPYDVFQVYAATCPDYICAVRPFEYRSTLFFGKPNWGIVDSFYYVNYWDVTLDNVKRKKIGYERKAFSQIHTCMSYTDIIRNNIQSSSSFMKTNISVSYNEKNGPKQTALMQVDSDIDLAQQTTGNITLPIKADNGPLNALGMYNYYNQHKYAEIAGISQLRDWVKEMYQGELTIIGDASINPYDIIYLNDIFNDMKGLLEVKRVTHHLEQGTGFLTVIQPDCCCVMDDTSKISQYTWLASKADNVGAFILGQYSQKKIIESILGLPIGYSAKRFGKLTLSFILQNAYFSQKEAATKFEKFIIKQYCDDMLTLTNDIMKKTGDLKNPDDVAKVFYDEVGNRFFNDIEKTAGNLKGKQDELLKFFETGITNGNFKNPDMAKEALKKFNDGGSLEDLLKYANDSMTRGYKSSIKFTELNGEIVELMGKQVMHKEALELAAKEGFILNKEAIKGIKLSEFNATKFSKLVNSKVFNGANTYFRTFFQKGSASTFVDTIAKSMKYEKDAAKVADIYKEAKTMGKAGMFLTRGSSKLAIAGAKGVGETASFVGRNLLKSIRAMQAGTAVTGIGVFMDVSISLLIDTALEHYSRWKRHRQSVIILPLLYRGRNFTAGLNGAKGSVVGTSMSKLDSFLMGQGWNPDATGALDMAVGMFNAVSSGDADYAHKEFADKYKKQVETMWNGVISEEVRDTEE